MSHAYHPDLPADPIDAMILLGSGPEPNFDPVLRDYLFESFHELQAARRPGGLLSVASLGLGVPWLFRLLFLTKGLMRSGQGEITETERHVVALRFLPDYLRSADRFAMLRLVEPAGEAFHPNISPSGAVCVEIYPGESLVEICQSLHDLFRWRLRQYDERDALNASACGWGRQNIQAPIDDRPLFGRRMNLQWQPTSSAPGS